MKRPNQYSKPLEGVRTENYHPADIGGQYEKDLNKYIDHLESQIKNSYSQEELLSFGKLVLDTFHSEGRTNSGKDRLARVKFHEWFEQFKKK